MTVKTRRAKSQRQKTEWDKLPKRERERLTDDYLIRVISGKPTRKAIDRIARLKGIRIRRSSSRS